MKDILQDIIANKRIEVERQKQAVRLQTLLGMGGERLEHPARSMRAALAASSSGIIAEFKRKSPRKPIASSSCRRKVPSGKFSAVAV